MDRNRFRTTLQTVGRLSVAVAREHVLQSLPDAVSFLVYPNQSYDGHPLVGDETVFPGDSLPEDQYHGPWTIDETVDFLWRSDKVPEWIDAGVEAEDAAYSLIGLRCCGRFTASEELLYHRRKGLSPFAIKSPRLPPRWVSAEASGRFDLYWWGPPRR